MVRITKGGMTVTSLCMLLPHRKTAVKELEMESSKQLIAACVGLILIAEVGNAGNCALRESVVNKLESRYSEKLLVRGLQSQNSLMEIFASADTGTFTVLITNPEGISCIVSAGTDLLVEDQKSTQPNSHQPGTAG